MKTKTVYLAFDDTPFDAAEACRAYEAQHVENRIVGLSIEQIRAAVSRDDIELAAAFEEIGNRIGRARREAGDLRRGRKMSADGDIQRASVEAGDADAKLKEALTRAKAAGLVAWSERKGAVVPDIWSTAKPLHDAWLEGWSEGQLSNSADRNEVAA